MVTSYDGTRHLLEDRLGYSKKGYVDGGIGVEWIKQFDKHTKEKAAGRRRLLLVDGHASHYTFGFLDYARRNRIHILCYPSHSTHVFQGLDVVIFSALKRHWTEARDTYERRTGIKVSKANFLSIYTEAHAKALTCENVKAAFRKTGVVPFNPSVVTPIMMAPSAESSVHGTLPLPQASPVRALSKLLLERTREQEGTGPDLPIQANATVPRTPPRTPQQPPNRSARDVLTSSSVSYLVSPSPIPSRAMPPRYLPAVVSPLKRRYTDLLDEKPQTNLEIHLQSALAESEKREAAHKSTMVGMQAVAVLQNLYVSRVQEKLQVQEEKGAKKKQKLLGDGLPRLMDADDFYSRVVEHEAAQEKDKADKEARQEARKHYDKEMDEWKEKEKLRKEWVAAQRDQYKKAMAAWDRERAMAKEERRRPALTKPLLGKIESALPKPKLSTRVEEEDGEEDDEDDEDADENED